MRPQPVEEPDHGDSATAIRRGGALRPASPLLAPAHRGLCSAHRHGQWSGWRDYGPALPSWVDLRGKALSHEIVEWAADPFLSNIVPPWLLSRATAQCYPLLEDADPVEQMNIGITGPDGRVTVVTNAVTLSWFARQSPSQALFGLYDLTGQVTQPAPACP
jgi:hypothetical protein